MAIITGELKIFTGNSNPTLVQQISEYLGMELSKATVSTFSDGEIRVRIDENVRGADVFIIQSCGHPVNTSIMEMLIMIDALKRSSASRITAVIPYYGYARLNSHPIVWQKPGPAPPHRRRETRPPHYFQIHIY